MDPTFAYGKAQAGVFGTALARMLDAPVLPFSFTEPARTYREYVDEVTQLATQRYGEARLDMSDVYAAVRRLGDAGEAFDEGIERVSGQGSRWLASRGDELRDINKEIYQTERDLANPDGLPRREWFRHTIYAPGLYTGYGVKTMPGIRESLEWGELDQAQNQASAVAAAIMRMAERVERLVERLRELRPAEDAERS